MVDDRGPRWREDEFRRIFADGFRPLLGYALRRGASPEDAADLAAETMLVAWRRLPEVPEGAAARLWLYGVARRLLANQRRGQDRRDRLAGRLRAQLGGLVVDPGEVTTTTQSVRAALARLSPDDRELVSLTVWEELEPREIAAVLGVPAEIVRTRLHRARVRLRRLLGDVVPPDGHVHRDGHPLVPEEWR